MNNPTYLLKSGEEALSYELISEGPKGFIKKRIQFTLVHAQGVYNLAFGDKDAATGDINDIIISNNGDSEKVLATVVAAIFIFPDQYPGAWVFASGSTAARTRLYQMGMNKYYDEAMARLDVWGQVSNNWYRFEKSRNYIAFLVKLKND